jgi:stage II sporulation protein D
VIRAGDNSVEASGHTTTKLKLDGDFRIVSEGMPTQHIRGAVVISVRDNTLWIVATIPLEQYVADVLQGETAGNMPEETLKALAVAIRSYTTRFRERHKEEGFDFCDTTHCQYLRLDPQPTVLSAVKQTIGELLWDKGTPLAAYYHKDCGGRTESAAAVWPDQGSPALVSHADPYCVRTTQPWRSEIARADLDRALAVAGLKVPLGWNRLAIAERTPSGRARTLRFSVGSTQQGALVSASSLRFAIGRTLGWNTLKSDWYDVAVQGDHFIFSGRGVGHGVGLCQTGAAEMARQGKSYREILAFYYPGTPIGRSAQGIPWTVIQAQSFELRVVNSGDTAIARSAGLSALEWATQRSGLSLHKRPIVEVYPTVAMFRDATGEPGWIAANTRNEVVCLQPPNVLRERFENVLRHEFLHMLVESNAKADTPLWFREGLVVYFGGDPPAANDLSMSGGEIDQAIGARRSDAEMRQAYAQAAAMVRDLDQKHGRAKIIEWLRSGLPEGIGRSAITARGHEVAH